MQKKLTISVDERVYDGLYRVVGPRRISQFIEELVRPHVVSQDLERGYAEMAGGDGSARMGRGADRRCGR
jgi:hypothetical protein